MATGIEIAPLAFGGNAFGCTVDEATSFRLLDAFCNAGFNLIDTADSYSRWAPGHQGGDDEHARLRHLVIPWTETDRCFNCARLSATRKFIVATAVAVLLAACAVQAPLSPESKEQRPSGFPYDFYQRFAERDSAVFHIEPALSLVVIEARRSGSLAHLGHDHVIASHNVRGYVAPNEARADLYIRLDELVVDEPELRAQAAFGPQPPEAAIAGTRENMLRQFHAEQHPYAVVSVESIDADATGPWLNASITLNGITRAVRIPVKIEQTADQLTVNGRVALEQTSFGIVPYSILGGALQVQDRVDVRFVIHARRVPS